MIWLVIFGCVWLAVGMAWWIYDERARYGPRTYGGARWRRETRLGLREAEQTQRETLEALTPEDRAWLKAMDWTPPKGLSGLPLIRL